MNPSQKYSFIEAAAPLVSYFALVLPLFFVAWQAAFPSLLGSRRHLRSIGVSFYVSGLSLLMGSIIRAKIENGQYLLVVFIVVFMLGMLLGLVALCVRENETGELVFGAGPQWARMAGITAYLFCAYLVFDLSRLGR